MANNTLCYPNKSYRHIFFRFYSLHLRYFFALLLTCYFSLTSSYCLSCDMTTFVQSEFAERCQKLISYCNKADTALLINHPDTDKRLSEVSKDWINFYLSHGNSNVQPPNMSFIAPQIWNDSLKELGYCFSSFTHKKQTQKEHELMLLKINCFKNEELLQNLHNSFKASELCEININKIDNIQEWFNCRFHGPFEQIFNYVEPYKNLSTDVKIEIEEHISDMQEFCKHLEVMTDDIKQDYFINLNNSIETTLLKWERIFMYK